MVIENVQITDDLNNNNVTVKIDGIEYKDKIISYKIERKVDNIAYLTITMPIKNADVKYKTNF